MKIWMQGAFVAVVAIVLCSAAAQAQTDVALSGYGTFTSSTSGFGTQQTPSNSAGGVVEVRHIVNPLIGYEFAYSFNPANQSYAPKSGACGLVCGEPPLSISGKANQIAGNWILSLKSGNLRPFVLGGIGFIFTVPGRSAYAVNSVDRPVYIYGAGLDWGVAPHVGVRLQVRGNMTKAPNLSDLYPSTTQYTQIYEPMAGVYYRF